MTNVICYGLASLAFVSMIACGGSDQNIQPRTAGVTATTGAPTDVEPGVQPGIPSPETPPIAATSPSLPPGALGPSEAAAGPPLVTWGTGAALASPPVESGGAVNDEQIAAVLAAANAEEVEVGRLVAKKARDARVRQFAEQVAIDHEDADAKLNSLDAKDGLTPREGPLSDDVKRGAEHVMISLRAGPAADFDKTYVDAQVEQQQKLVSLVDGFIPQAKSADLKRYLAGWRSVLAQHLRRAQEIRFTLAK